jgi:hypothetical protein
MHLAKSRASRDFNAAEIFGDDPIFNHSTSNSALKRFNGTFGGHMSENDID